MNVPLCEMKVPLRGSHLFRVATNEHLKLWTELRVRRAMLRDHRHWQQEHYSKEQNTILFHHGLTP